MGPFFRLTNLHFIGLENPMAAHVYQRSFFGNLSTMLIHLLILFILVLISNPAV